MAPPRGTKRKSDETGDHVRDASNLASQTVATKTGSSSGQTSPRKKQKTGISLGQKQALIDNLQLEITERARKLRAQYNLQAQGLRTRIEIRVNRIPMALRKAKMGELADKYINGQHPQQVRPTPSHSTSHSTRPQVPEKDNLLARVESSTSTKSYATTSSRPGPGRQPKRTSDEISGNSKKGGEATDSEGPKKKLRTDANAAKASKVLSPASSNIQSMSRATPGGKPPSLRPAPAAENAFSLSKSPTKQSSVSNLFGSWAEKARSPKKKGSAASSSTTASSATGTAGGNVGSASATGTSKTAAAKTQRRFSGISETSESGTSTVGTKGAEKKSAPAKRTGGVMGSIRRGVAGATAKKAAAKKAAPASTATGRVLRNRNP
ncbi:hypothetical protein N0V93_001118 [Gnomoniopsis smithogilvyi]|uniref:Borealin N-terminal domain-containing protein n=1 Tax=Gnomoniopsis smithogilvyi TaxID=1191159 RepID=A0A9W8Z115_9PEZI|nr:hypothetical protein N0V93_001118 [Gnomoniopsis smithogilvyi]